jgi:SAM-dependent methyltransferase
VVDVVRVRPAPWLRRGRVERPLPLLGPPWAEALLRFSPAQLRAACEARGLAAPVRASRNELAQLLTRDKARASAEETYRDGQIPFPEHESDYPLLCRLMTQHGFRHVLDLGCGPGMLAEHALRAGVLPPDGSYLGVDNTASAIELARKRLAGECRARFELCDLAAEIPRAPRADGLVLSFVISYLDTHAADRLLRRMARAWPRATLLVALSVRTSLNGPEEYPPERPTRRFLDGDRRALAPWDTQRMLCYTRAVDDHFGIIEEHRCENYARIVWVARRSPARGRRPAR